MKIPSILGLALTVGILSVGVGAYGVQAGNITKNITCADTALQGSNSKKIGLRYVAEPRNTCSIISSVSDAC